jgi:MFS family permease
MEKRRLSVGTKILLIGGGFWYFGEGMFGPLLAVFTEQVGGDIFNVSWAWSVYLFVYGALSIVIGYYADFFNKGILMVVGYALNAAFTFAYLLVDNPTSLLLVQSGLGVAAALATPTWNALFDEWSSASVDGYSWGLSEGVASIITAIAILVGGMVVYYFSFTTLFITMGFIQVIATVYQSKILLYEAKHHA